jgi:hypothetical protein
MIEDLIRELISAIRDNTQAINDLRDSLHVDEPDDMDDDKPAATTAYMDGTPIG